MRILFVIPHYFTATAANATSRRHGSTSSRSATRAEAIGQTIAALHRNFGKDQALIRHQERTTQSANDSYHHEVTVVVVVQGDNHVLDEVDLPDDDFRRKTVGGDPRHLGFHAQRVLAEHLHDHDYFCYLEDDLIVEDAWLFEKLRWFVGHVGEHSVLLPNRFEASTRAEYRKVYLDGDLVPRLTECQRDHGQRPRLSSTVMGRQVEFIRPSNPHSGCFFLTASQLQTWSTSDDFARPTDRFVGHLESAATLGLMEHFRVYKPAAKNASFLEIRHHGDRFARLIRRAT